MDRPPLTFRRRQRLTHDREFQRVYAQGVRRHRGPITVVGVVNSLGYARLGLAVGRRVGGAAVRNAVKRRLREAFRLSQHTLLPPGAGLDLVVSVRPGRVESVGDYASMLGACVGAIERELRRMPPPAP
ncbi:MAG: ribonuclease P protein component [Phycisphaerales bacterium]|nr:ribonuclease P protein component [Phycisphaerales bacterium]